MPSLDGRDLPRNTREFEGFFRMLQTAVQFQDDDEAATLWSLEIPWHPAQPISLGLAEAHEKSYENTTCDTQL